LWTFNDAEIAWSATMHLSHEAFIPLV
jgi:hypothetical protein